MTIEAVQWYRTETVLIGMIAIGLIWLVMDRLVFVPLERATVQRWGIVQR
jgi:NitT/TauT family transport system permease protein/taurine transport system permease protein